MNINDVSMSHLAHRSRTTLEMKQFLEKKEFSSTEIEEELARLTDLHYIDDLRYCEEYLRYRMGKRQGRRNIFRELREKGINGDLLELGIDRYEESEGLSLSQQEYENACREAEKIAQDRPMDKKLLGKMGRRLSTLGYDSELIYTLMGNYMNKD
ncbi:MAG: regulatory protein RecX [Anaerovoracaceae bacterium]